MEIPLGATVDCLDGTGGYFMHVIVNSKTRRLTHLVVLESGLFGVERIVPLSRVVSGGDDHIGLCCTRADLEPCQEYIEHEYMPGAWPIFPYQLEHYAWWPIATRRKLNVGEVAIRSAARVYAVDGWVGRPAGFVVDCRQGELKHVIVREGHFWNRKEVIVPVAQVEVLSETGIRLALDHRSIKALPPMPAHHGAKA